jgi:plastocyanin
VKKRWMVSVSVVAFAAACSQYSGNTPTVVGPSSRSGSLAEVDGQGPGTTPLAATLQFGMQGHVDAHAAAEAQDNLVPRTVVVRTGGTVTFNAPAAVHQIAIYKPGTEPGDINTTNLQTLNAYAGCTSANPNADSFFKNVPIVINDATNRQAKLPVPCLSQAAIQYTFDTPGRYLVICAFLPHFNLQMYGWVIVRD